MSEQLTVIEGCKEEKYKALLPQLRALVESESDIIANMANISACLRDTFHFWWVGFYRVVDGDLLLGPFQGSLACTRIRKGSGVCGTALERQTTIIVPDVDRFPGHIACSSLSRSEIVVPVFHRGTVVAILDIDSEHLNHFDDCDRRYLKQIATLLDK